MYDDDKHVYQFGLLLTKAQHNARGVNRDAFMEPRRRWVISSE